MPFATDSTGVCSVFCDADAVVIGHDPGATALRCYGFTEKRDDKTAAYAGIPVGELSCVMGDSKTLIDNYINIISRYDKSIIVFAGTPVSTLLNFDLKGLARQLEEKTGKTVLAFSTTGNRYYDKGMADVFSAILGRFAATNASAVCESIYHEGCIKNAVDTAPGVNLLGLNTLDIPWKRAPELIKAKISEAGYNVLSVWGMESDIKNWEKSASGALNVVCSASAYRAAERMKQTYGIPYVMLYDLIFDDESISENKFSSEISVLIIGEQVYANGLRKALKKMGASNVDAAGFFDMNKSYMEKNDVSLRAEDDLERLIAEREYNLIVGDPLFSFFISKDSDCVLFPVKHPPVSGNFSRKMRSFDPYDKEFFKELCLVSHSISME